MNDKLISFGHGQNCSLFKWILYSNKRKQELLIQQNLFFAILTNKRIGRVKIIWGSTLKNESLPIFYRGAHGSLSLNVFPDYFPGSQTNLKLTWGSASKIGQQHIWPNKSNAISSHKIETFLPKLQRHNWREDSHETNPLLATKIYILTIKTITKISINKLRLL